MSLTVKYNNASYVNLDVTLTDRDEYSIDVPYEIAHFLLTSTVGDSATGHGLLITRLSRGFSLIKLLRWSDVVHERSPVSMLLWNSNEEFKSHLQWSMTRAIIAD